MDVLHNTETPQSTDEANQKGRAVLVKRKSAWSTVAFAFLLLLLISLGVAAWLWMMWRDSENRLEASQADVTTAQIQVADLREQLGMKNGADAALQNLPTNDEQSIKAVARDYNNALAVPLADATFEMTKRDGDQAIAKVSGVTAGYDVYLKRVNGAWIVVWAGQDMPTPDVIKQFGLKL